MVECEEVVLARFMAPSGILIKHLIVQLSINKTSYTQISLTSSDKITSWVSYVWVGGRTEMNFMVIWLLFCRLSLLLL